jgi:hypothetical protein
VEAVAIGEGHPISSLNFLRDSSSMIQCVYKIALTVLVY